MSNFFEDCPDDFGMNGNIRLPKTTPVLIRNLRLVTSSGLTDSPFFFMLNLLFIFLTTAILVVQFSF
jgi:hypothetical protein